MIFREDDGYVEELRTRSYHSCVVVAVFFLLYVCWCS